MQRRSFFKAALGLFASVPAVGMAATTPQHSPTAETTGITASAAKPWTAWSKPKDLYEEAVQHISESELLRALPWLNLQGGAYVYLQAPGVGTKGFPESYLSDTGVINPQIEVLRVAGGDVEIDKALLRTHGTGLIPQQRRMFLRDRAYQITDEFVNGTTGTTWRGEVYPVDGLRQRFIGQQHVQVNGRLSRGVLDEAIHRVDTPTHLLVPVEMRDALKKRRLLKRSGATYRYTTADGKAVVTVIVDYRRDGKPPILGWTEEANTASAYVLNLDKDGITGLQNGDIQIAELGYIEAKPVHCTRYEWLIAWAILQGKAGARMSGITEARIV